MGLYRRTTYIYGTCTCSTVMYYVILSLGGHWTINYTRAHTHTHIHTYTHTHTQRLSQLQQEVEEMKSNAKHVEGILATWESLASRAQQVPPVRWVTATCIAVGSIAVFPMKL